MTIIHLLIATVGGYFWHHCKTCGKGFGGHQWTAKRSYWMVEMKDVHTGTCVYCPKCAGKRKKQAQIKQLAEFPFGIIPEELSEDQLIKANAFLEQASAEQRNLCLHDGFLDLGRAWVLLQRQP